MYTFKTDDQSSTSDFDLVKAEYEMKKILFVNPKYGQISGQLDFIIIIDLLPYSKQVANFRKYNFSRK